MKYGIDPTVDCVFKAILGSEENKNLLIHFINAIVKLPDEHRIVEVTIVNPYNEKEFLSDKTTIVDVKAQDQNGVMYQIEVQVVIHTFLRERMLYLFCDLYAAQLKRGKEFDTLKPVIAIWVLPGNLLREDERYHHHFRMCDPDAGIVLDEWSGIHLLELEKWKKTRVEDDEDKWVRLFKEGEELDDEALPEEMDTPEMRQAMETIKQFSEKDRAYDLYQRRLDYIRVQKAFEWGLEDARRREAAAVRREEEAMRRGEEAMRREEEAMRREEEAMRREAEAMREKETAVKEKERLLKLLLEAGIDPENAREPERA